MMLGRWARRRGADLGDVIAGAGLFSWHEPPSVIAPSPTAEKTN